MVAIPKQNKIKSLLDEDEITHEPRGYLGFSNIGESCIRKHQFDLRMAWSETISRRIKRLFNFGHYMEQVFIDDLERIGITVQDRQIEIIGFAGHWKGHIDGTGIGIPGAEKTKHLLEFKTHNDKSFKELLKHEEVKKAHRRHYDQCQKYMGELELTRTLYIGYNKNDSSYYVERIHFNQDDYDDLCHKEKEVIFQEGLAPRIGTGKPTWHECRFCDAHNICFGKKNPVRNCRTCEHVQLIDDGGWHCELKNYDLSLDEQIMACDDYELEGILHELGER